VTSLCAATLEAILPDRPMRVELNGVPVALSRVGHAVYACRDVCAHRGAPLSEGKLSGTRLTCPWHGWMYDVRTGQCTFPGRGAAVPTYPVRITDGQVWVDLP
jgi:nitrite reductase/ring-hydroxylating ferredoxin subunit